MSPWLRPSIPRGCFLVPRRSGRTPRWRYKRICTLCRQKWDSSPLVSHAWKPGSRQMYTPPLGRLPPMPRRRSLGRGHRLRRLAKLGKIRDSQGIGQGCGPRPNATRSAPPVSLRHHGLGSLHALLYASGAFTPSPYDGRDPRGLAQGHCPAWGAWSSAPVPATQASGYGPRCRALMGVVAGTYGHGRRMVQTFCISV